MVGAFLPCKPVLFRLNSFIRQVGFLGLFLCLVSGRGQAQFFSFSPFFGIEVSRGGSPLPQAFCGGFNSGQFVHCDLNNDGLDDLIVYDKASRKSLTFIQALNGSTPFWQYRPEFEDILPPLESWVATADFNCDGKLDIFTQTSSGIKVFRNTSLSPGQAAFSLEADGLVSQGNNGMVNIQVNPYGAPAFTDVDGDGDMDILTFNFSGNTVEYHQNRILETSGNCAGMQFKKDSCVFGLFATKPTCGDIRLNTGCFGQRPAGGGDLAGDPDAVPARIQHVGSQLCALDLDGDNDKDLLVGDIGCSLLNRLTNGGSAQSAVITQADTLFPSPSQYVKVDVFPSAYPVDANLDGKTDLVISPTFFNNYTDGFVHNTRQGAHLYVNQSTTSVPSYILAERDFLQRDAIELGEEASPAFADVDADGDMDLFVGHLGRKQGGQLQSSIYFFRNIGTILEPRYDLETSDFLGLSEWMVKRIRPVIEDFNGDGAIDFGWMSSPGTIPTDSTRLRFLLNQNPAGQPFSFPALSQTRLFPLNFNLYDCPVFTDIDGDGLRDMLVGKYSGRIQYWRQTQPWPNWQYQLGNANYGNIARAPFATNPVLALADADQNGQLDLVVGDFTGQIKIYRDFRQQPFTQFTADSTTFFNTILNLKLSHSWSNYVSPALADLNGDGFPEMVIGQAGGGLGLLVNRLGPNAIAKLPPGETPVLFPNPLPLGERLSWRDAKPDHIRLFSVRGEDLGAGEFSNGTWAPGAHVRPGLYFIHFELQGRPYVQRLSLISNE
jgi:hypothetical protein